MAINMTMSGDGAIANGRAQENITISISSSQIPQGLGNLTTSVIYADGKYYTMISGTGTAQDGQWYVADVPTDPNMTSGGLTELDPKYADAYKVTEVGKDSVNGAPTTKYQVDVDLQKYLEILGVGDPTTGQMVQNSKMTMYLWIGDADQYLYKDQIVMDARVPVPSTSGSDASEVSIVMDMTVTYKDFDTPITIDVPANAIPIGNLTGGSSSMESPTSMAGSLSLIASVAGMSGGPSQMPTGMPTTGRTDTDFPWGLAALALLCFIAGVRLRQRSPTQ
jgi:hypothetical protein